MIVIKRGDFFVGYVRFRNSVGPEVLLDTCYFVDFWVPFVIITLLCVAFGKLTKIFRQNFFVITSLFFTKDYLSLLATAVLGFKSADFLALTVV